MENHWFSIKFVNKFILSFICINTLRLRQNGLHFTDDTFKCVFLNENVRIPIKISLKFVPTGSINSIPALVQIMAWCWPGDKPLSESMMVRLLTFICITWPQWAVIQDNVKMMILWEYNALGKADKISDKMINLYKNSKKATRAVTTGMYLLWMLEEILTLYVLNCS